MSNAYSVQLEVWTLGGDGYFSELLNGNDTPGDQAATYGLADPLTITRKLSSDPRLPLSHPEPDEATFALIAADSTTYADMALGDPVAIYYWPLASRFGTPLAFYGRVAGIAADPHPLGVKLTVTCLDYTADLAELPVGLTNYPLESLQSRVNRITDQAGLPRVPTPSPPGGTFWPSIQLAARSASQTDAYSLLRETLDSSGQVLLKDENGVALVGDHSPSYRGYLVPNITAGLLDTTTPFLVRYGKPWTRRIAYTPPLRLTNVSGVYTVTASAADSSPSTGAPAISASRVEFAPTFTQTKGGDLATVTTGTDAQGNRYTWDWRAVQSQWSTGGAVWGPGGWTPYYSGAGAIGAPAVIQQLDSVLDVTDAGAGPSPAGLVMHYRVPYATDGLAAWAVGTMAWQLWAEPVAVYSWTGAANASTSTKRTQDGKVETNLHTDPRFAGAGTTLGFVANAGTTLAKDVPNAWRGVVPALKVTATTENWGYLIGDGTTHSGTVCPTCVSGRTYTARFIVMSDTAQTVMAIQYGTNAANGTPVALSPGTYAVVTVTWTAGAQTFLSVRRQDRTTLLGNLWIAAPMVVEGSTGVPTWSGTTPFWAPGDPASPDVQWRVPELTELLTVAGAQAGKLPTNREWVSGLVVGTQLQLARGRAVVNLDVAPPSYDFVADGSQLGASSGVIRMDSPAQSGVTLAQVSTRDTLNDYTLVRGS